MSPQGGPSHLAQHFFLLCPHWKRDHNPALACQIFAHDAAQEAGEGLNGELSGAREALNAAVKKNAADAEIDQLAAAVGVINGRLAAIHAKASAKFYALLTAEQKTKYDQMGDRGGPGGPGRFRRQRAQ